MDLDILNNSKVQLDDILNKIAESIQVDDTRLQRMEKAYKAVNDWIDKDEGFFNNLNFEVYPQGSVKIGTAIRPKKDDEFDLDTVIQIEIRISNISPEEVYNELKRRLMENEVYTEKIILKNRCIRLDYSGDFHMDILPGCSSDRKISEIFIPDREKADWVISNPKGYAEWFLNRAQSNEFILLEKAYAHEDLPDKEPVNFKAPLKRSVQLVKYFRNEFFREKMDKRPSSVILTTLYAKYYNGQNSIFETLIDATKKIQHEIKSAGQNYIKVTNPVNGAEDFSEKWTSEPHLYEEFKSFIVDLFELLESLDESENRVNDGVLLKRAFGNDNVVSAYQKQSEFVNRLREFKKLNVDKKNKGLSTIATASTVPVKKNTFYGEW